MHVGGCVALRNAVFSWPATNVPHSVTSEDWYMRFIAPYNVLSLLWCPAYVLPCPFQTFLALDSIREGLLSRNSGLQACGHQPSSNGSVWHLFADIFQSFLNVHCSHLPTPNSHPGYLSICLSVVAVLQPLSGKLLIDPVSSKCTHSFQTPAGERRWRSLP